MKITKYKKVKTPKNHFHHRVKSMNKHSLIFEQYHKCCLLPKANIHHIDGNENNNDPTNLMGFINISKHKTYENGASKRICLRCKSNKTYFDKYGFPQWHTFPDGYVCVKCFTDLGLPKMKDRGFVNPGLRQNKRPNESYSEMDIIVNSMNTSNSFTLKHNIEQR